MSVNAVPTDELLHAQERLAYYSAKAPYKTKDRGSFGWGAEIAFWKSEVERLSEKERAK